MSLPGFNHWKPGRPTATHVVRALHEPRPGDYGRSTRAFAKRNCPSCPPLTRSHMRHRSSIGLCGDPGRPVLIVCRRGVDVPLPVLAGDAVPDVSVVPVGAAEMFSVAGGLSPCPCDADSGEPSGPAEGSPSGEASSAAAWPLRLKMDRTKFIEAEEGCHLAKWEGRGSPGIRTVRSKRLLIFPFQFPCFTFLKLKLAITLACDPSRSLHPLPALRRCSSHSACILWQWPRRGDHSPHVPVAGQAHVR